MKTIDFNRSRGSMLTTALVLGGLAALYFYRRTGGRFIVPLVETAAGLIATRVGKSSAEPTVEKEATEALTENSQLSAAPKARKSRRASREVSTSTVDMDSLPAT